jgi:hypothetical protein
MSFKEWLKMNEEGTSTSCIAAFPRPIGIGTVSRQPVDMFFKKKKKKSGDPIELKY